MASRGSSRRRVKGSARNLVRGAAPSGSASVLSPAAAPTAALPPRGTARSTSGRPRVDISLSVGGRRPAAWPVAREGMNVGTGEGGGRKGPPTPTGRRQRPRTGSGGTRLAIPRKRECRERGGEDSAWRPGEIPFARHGRTTSGETPVEVSREWLRKLVHAQHPRKGNARSPAGDARGIASPGVAVGRIHRRPVTRPGRKSPAGGVWRIHSPRGPKPAGPPPQEPPVAGACRQAVRRERPAAAIERRP